MDDNTRSINKINEQIKLLNSEPKNEKKQDIENNYVFENDDTMIVDKIENIEKDNNKVNDEITKEEKVVESDNIQSDNKAEVVVNKDNFLILYLIIVVLLIILGILIYFL